MSGEAVFIWVLAGLFGISVVRILRDVDIVARMLRRHALRRGGRVKMSLMHYPRLTFQDDGTEITVSGFFGTKGVGKSTFAEFTLPRLRRHGFNIDSVSRSPNRSGYDPTSTGTDAFDTVFVAHAADGEFLRRLLTPELKDALLTLERANPAGVRVSVTDPRPERPRHEGRVWVSIAGLARTSEKYDRLIEVTLALRRRLAEVLAERRDVGQASADEGA